jgi:serine/threonine protein kinase
LVDADGVAKISDFGISKKNEYQMAYQRVTRMSMQGSIYWMAPEVASAKGYSAKVDIWSLGCLVLEMLTGTQPWNGVKGNIMLLLGQGNTPPVPDDLSPLAKDILEKCFRMYVHLVYIFNVRDPEARPTASELLKHPFADVDPTEFDFRAWHMEVMEKKAAEDALKGDSDSDDDSSDYSDSEEEEDEVSGEEETV